MIQVFPAASRYSVDHGWLKTSLSFSFADYYDPDNTNFGPMRVLNDDHIAPARGFGAHPHSDMEIVSIVLKGQMRHEDNLGNRVVTRFGEVQRMSAGTGAIHTEFNSSRTDELNLLQMWFMPERNGLEPSYEATKFDVSRLSGNLLPVVSHTPSDASVAKIHQDFTIYLSRLEDGDSLDFTQTENRRVFLFIIDGQVTLNEATVLQKRDSARITEVTNLHITASAGTLLLLIDLP